jgi:calcineurin-like phosphoesterase family protein
MRRIFFAADHHFGHQKLLTILRPDGSQLRKFATREEHDEYLVAAHNSAVREQDVVYLLGDVVIHKLGLGYLSRLRGSIRLIAGNHDIFRALQYLECGVRDIRGSAYLCLLYTSPSPRDH